MRTFFPFLTLLLLLLSMVARGQEKQKQTAQALLSQLPEWFLKQQPLDDLILSENYQFDNRLDPVFLEADLNGDSIMDIALPIIEISSQKRGFAIVHGKTNEVFIIGAGTKIKSSHSDEMSYIDSWRVNRKTVNQPGLDENGEEHKNGPLILKNPSIEI
jgi:hypothetical protein